MTDEPARATPLPSARDRLMLAFADLNRYGIVARPALGLEPESAREALSRAITARHPHATGAYIFWTAADDASFTADGSLGCSLHLHHSGDNVARAAHAALRRVGMLAADLAEPPRLRIDGLHPAPPAAPQARVNDSSIAWSRPA